MTEWRHSAAMSGSQTNIPSGSRKPRLSVVIPHLNEPEELHNCLDALVAQRDDSIPFEIIVVDNGSQIPPQSVPSDVRVEIELNPGPGPARNRGASVAQADVVAFIDADCIAQAGWVRGIVEFFDENPELGCLAGDIRIAQANPQKATAIEAYENIFSYRVQLYVERDHYAATGNMAVRRHIFDAVGPFGGIAVMEDWDWGQRARALGVTIAYVPQVCVRTPPCKTFSEIMRRWDRHIAHEYKEISFQSASPIQWILRSILVAMSPLKEVLTIAQSNKVVGLKERGLALLCVSRVRFYRACKMLQILLRQNDAQIVGSWNRQ